MMLIGFYSVSAKSPIPHRLHLSLKKRTHTTISVSLLPAEDAMGSSI